MEKEKNLFDLQLDSLSKSHLKETAKWARLLAIVGMIGVGLILVVSTITTINVNGKTDYNGNDDINDAAYIAGYTIGTLLVGAIFFLPSYFLLRFANKMNRALAADDIASFNEAFKNLKVTFRYVGILTIIFLALLAAGLLANLSGNS
jgi:hypothetical protein